MTHVQSNPLPQSNTSRANALQPLPLSKSIPLFAAPTLIAILSHYQIAPFLESLGYTALNSYLMAMTIPMVFMFGAALYGYHQVERRPFTWSAFRERMRFTDLRRRDLWLVIAMLAGSVILPILVMPVNSLIIDANIVPENLPVLLDPARNPEKLHDASGGSIHGQWEALLFYAVFLFFNIAGEELWWRGYILPRQELSHGQWAWLIHGIMWTFFHLFRWWDLILIVPTALLWSYVAYRFKSNWAITITHFIANFSLATFVIAGVIGIF